jgi:hypothetical protein
VVAFRRLASYFIPEQEAAEMIAVLNITATIFLIIAAAVSAAALPLCAAMVLGRHPRKRRHRPF